MKVFGIELNLPTITRPFITVEAALEGVTVAINMLDRAREEHARVGEALMDKRSELLAQVEVTEYQVAEHAAAAQRADRVAKKLKELVA